MAGDLPGRAGEALLTAARAAFTAGMQTAVLVAAGVMACAAVAALTLLRGLRTTGVEGEGDATGAAGAQRGAALPAGAEADAGAEAAGTPTA